VVGDPIITDAALSQGQKRFAVSGARSIEPAEAKHYAGPAGKREAVRAGFGGIIRARDREIVGRRVFVDPIAALIAIQHTDRFLHDTCNACVDRGIDNRGRALRAGADRGRRVALGSLRDEARRSSLSIPVGCKRRNSSATPHNRYRLKPGSVPKTGSGWLARGLVIGLIVVTPSRRPIVTSRRPWSRFSP
jgi:hypothetical protein